MNKLIKIKDVCVDADSIYAVAVSVYPVNVASTDKENPDAVQTIVYPAINVYCKETTAPLVLTYTTVEERDHYYMELMGILNIGYMCNDYVEPSEVESDK